MKMKEFELIYSLDYLYAVADLRGERGTHASPPPRVQILSISFSFGEILAKSYVGAPGGLASPPQGNPGSATGMCHFSPHMKGRTI